MGQFYLDRKEFILRSLPVLVYHHVNNLGEDITEEQFDAQMRFLAEHGYRTIFLREWIKGKVEADGKTVAITFDDGYLDNWVYAFPILEKYDIKATIFVATVRCLDNLLYRPNLNDIWSGRCNRDMLPDVVSNWEANHSCVLRENGNPHFLTWEEMRKMESSGLIDIQSHSHYHRDFFVSNQIVDFNQNKYFGLGWATDGDTRYGIPIYPRKSGMVARRYHDDRGLRDFVAERVLGREYFSNRSKREYMKDLLRSVVDYREQHKLEDYFETKEDQKKRIIGELLLSKKIIEEQIGKTCTLICWPWGEYSRTSVELARQAGYKGAVTFSAGFNLENFEFRRWHIRRFPPPRSVGDFAKAILIFSSPMRSFLFKWKKTGERHLRKMINRAKEGQLFPSIKRKIRTLTR